MSSEIVSTKANNQVPWRRLPAESPQAWEAFRIYRDINNMERTIDKVCLALGKSRTLISGWSSKYQWRIRVQSYDDHVSTLAEERGKEALLSMRQRHAHTAMTVIALAAAKAAKTRTGEIKVRDLANLLKVGTEVERLARGDVSEHASASPVNIDIGLSFGQNDRAPTWLKPTLPANNDYVVYGDSKRLTREISGSSDLSPLKSEQLAKASDGGESSSNGGKMPVRLGADQEVSTQQTERPTTPPRKRRYSRGGAQPPANILPKKEEPIV